MKKIILSLIAVMATMSINAQVVKVYKNNTLKATYTNTSTDKYKVVFEEAPAGPEYVTITSTDGTKTMKWATMNLDATTVAESPETAYGNYYAWGATETWYSSILWEGSTPTITWKDGYTDGYSSNHVPTVKGNTLSATEDIATITYPGWHMPTTDEFQWLASACGGSFTKRITTSDAIPTAQGIYFIDKRDATYKVSGMLFIDSKGTSVFFPAAGYWFNTSFYYGDVIGIYCSSSLYTSYTYYAYRMYFNSSSVEPSNNGRHDYGFPVRPVSE